MAISRQQTLNAAGGFAGIIILGLGIFFLNDHLESKSQKEREDKISVSISYAPKECEASYPLLVLIKNENKDYRLTKITLWPEARHQGRSSNIWNEPNYSDIESDYILEPGESAGTCYRLPTSLQDKEVNPKLLKYEIKKGWVTFEAVTSKRVL